MTGQTRIRSYKDLLVWQKARALVRAVYEATREFPREETYGLRMQVRRAAVSVPSNIAEGYGRGTRRDYVHFLQTARGSLYEVETQVLVSEDLGLLPPAICTPLLAKTEECSVLLHRLIVSLTKETYV